MEIITPSYRWNGPLLPRETTTHLILHHAAAETASAQDIHRFHQQLGWAGIGYHYYVRKDGRVYQGRPPQCVGAHTVGYNTCSLGVCFEGNFEREEMGRAQREAGQSLVRRLLASYGALTLLRHCDCDATACPGRHFPFAAFSSLTGEEEQMDYSEFLAFMARYEREQREHPVSDYAAQPWARASALSLLDGSAPARPLLREQAAVLLDRLGLLEGGEADGGAAQ